MIGGMGVDRQNLAEEWKETVNLSNWEKEENLSNWKKTDGGIDIVQKQKENARLLYRAGYAGR